LHIQFILDIITRKKKECMRDKVDACMCSKPVETHPKTICEA
jgi:hypothetical protein